MEYTGRATLEYDQRSVEVDVVLVGEEYDPQTGRRGWWRGSYATEDFAGVHGAMEAKAAVTLRLDDNRCGEVLITRMSFGSGVTGDLVGNGALPT